MVAIGFDGSMPQHYAAIAGKIGVLKWLIEEAGASIEERRVGDEATVLHLAAAKGHVEMVQWLVEEQEADLGALDAYGLRPQDRAWSRGYTDVADYLGRYARYRHLKQRKKTYD